ncbi:TonB family protein [Oxalobacteraceae bacterium]|nr:TonB family protein [Oxalobacteraceae bacterium]
MSSMTMSHGYGADRNLLTLQQRARKAAPLAAIVLVHAVFFYALQSGMMSKAVHAVLPQVVNVTFVAPPAPEKPSTPPKTVQIAQRTPTFVPPLPVVAVQQTEPTITLPQAQAKPAEASAVAVAAPAPLAPAPAPVVSAPKTISGVEYVRAPQPVYPSISRRMGETGVVMLRVLIGERGQPEQVLVHKSSGSSNLDEAGRQAALRALYKPYLEDGKAVSVYVLVPINFQLS